MASKEEIAAMKKEASDLEAKVEKMMMEKVRALFFSAPPFCGFFSPAAERCWDRLPGFMSTSMSTSFVRRRTRCSRRWRRTSMWRP